MPVNGTARGVEARGKLRNAKGVDDKRTHGQQLSQAMDAQAKGRKAIADLLGVNVRTVTNWTTGRTMPTEGEKTILRAELGNYDAPGDLVESAIRRSGLVEWRQDAVISEYKRHLYDQGREQAV